MKTNALFLCLALAAIIVGCKEPQSASAPLSPSKPVERAVSGGKELTASGISLTFPKDWETIDMTQGEFETAMKGLEKNPRGSEMMAAAKAAAQSGMIKMFAFDPNGSKPGFMNNANLVVQPGVGSATLDQALEASKKQIEGMGGKAAASKVTFPAGEFGRLESQLKAPNGADYVAIGYCLISGGELTVVTFSCLPDQVKAFDTKAQSIMKTFVKK